MDCHFQSSGVSSVGSSAGVGVSVFCLLAPDFSTDFVAGFFVAAFFAAVFVTAVGFFFAASLLEATPLDFAAAFASAFAFALGEEAATAVLLAASASDNSSTD